MPRLHFEDFIPGTSQIYGSHEVSEESIIAFAREYDPQPFHVDPEAAKDTFVGTLIGSGWHSCSINMRLISDGFLLDTAAMGAPGIEEVRWLKPMLPGDVLCSRVTVMETRTSQSRPELGLVRFGLELIDQSDKAVLTQTNWILIARRGAPPPTPLRPPQETSPAGEDVEPADPQPSNLFFEDIQTGVTQDLGAYHFSAERIVGFAREFDPQRFHVDPDAARESLFGGLCASGWQTAAGWMNRMCAHRNRVAQGARARGERVARLGSSPGFKNLRWLKPVYAGDTIRYRSTFTDKRRSGSRPGWGLAFHHNTGTNQRGEEVFSFDGVVFWEARDG
ncbi:MaoC family dehydratase [Microvirga massiliensis]|uniref:MaoC family dehydratase n=1 Tax=Microvirga massiliensis TaxID=1033741 RepID=UPI00062B3FCB|nr:MaoC family dehydratase [Microvirga massiliensis]